MSRDIDAEQRGSVCQNALAVTLGVLGTLEGHFLRRENTRLRVLNNGGFNPGAQSGKSRYGELRLMLADSLFLQTRRWDAVQEVARYVAELEAQADFGLAAKYRAVLVTLLGGDVTSALNQAKAMGSRSSGERATNPERSGKHSVKSVLNGLGTSIDRAGD